MGQFDVKKLGAFPTRPGVYLMKGEKGDVLYVGKALNLRQRVKQYFLKGGDGRAMIPFLISQVVDIETIVVGTEKEALLLESNLIKQHKPKYNVLFKDDKSYIALKINHKHKWPKLELTRYKGKPKADGIYFGPYAHAYAARQTLELLQKTFPMRQCSDQELARRTRPCILYDMKRCVAPCVDYCTEEEYDELVKGAIQFLKGKNQEVLKVLHEKRQQAAEALEFETAGYYHRAIQRIEKLLEKQLVDKPLGEDSDILGWYREADRGMLTLMRVRDGRLLDARHYPLKKVIEEDDTVLTRFILQHYTEQLDRPKEILVPFNLSEELNTILETIYWHLPQRGDKRKLLEMAQLNAESAFKKEKDTSETNETLLVALQDKLHLNRLPRRIECIDNSHLAGDQPVAALIAYTDGQKNKEHYRKYILKTTDPADDYGAMREVLTRRFKRAKEENNLPDLMIIDGGKGHLNMALKVFQELNIISIDLIAVTKEEGRHDRGMTAERVFLPNRKDPLHFPPHSPLLFFLQQVRDEAHRFAITFQRKKRSKKLISSKLATIPGIGPAKQKILLKHFGSLKNIENASLDTLSAVPGISVSNAESIYHILHRGNR
ncbi:MAG: excinuclease ABC subunit UvrC [Chlamydiia bacterium]|nr:excinuclease ABC subunit UvrC [Chlamydiia bacterium]